MNIRDLQYLVAVAELQHFGRAAERCHVSQPTLSTQIRKLEDYLGVPLFERSGRRVMVSAAGEQIVERARALIRDYEELQRVAQRLKDPAAGQYRLGVFPTLAPYFLPMGWSLPGAWFSGGESTGESSGKEELNHAA